MNEWNMSVMEFRVAPILKAAKDLGLEPTIVKPEEKGQFYGISLRGDFGVDGKDFSESPVLNELYRRVGMI